MRLVAVVAVMLVPLVLVAMLLAAAEAEAAVTLRTLASSTARGLDAAQSADQSGPITSAASFSRRLSWASISSSRGLPLAPALAGHGCALPATAPASSTPSPLTAAVTPLSVAASLQQPCLYEPLGGYPPSGRGER